MITQFFKVCENKNFNRIAIGAWFKRVSLFFILCLSGAFSHAGVSPKYQQGASVKTLVIDPGHGGKDPGAIGPGGHYEARLALAISLKFGELVEKNYPNVKVVYTRKTDEFVSLKGRADLANKVKADLFFCIHLNSSKNREAYGTSTYALGLHRAEDNLEIAKEAQDAARRENAVIELEEGGLSNYDFDPNSPEGHIIMSMKQNAFLDQSLKIAAAVEEQQLNFAKRKSRGVKQAGFWVLYRTAMPAILTEIGFISNPTEEKFLASEEGQRTIAASLFKAFVNYKNNIEGRNDVFDLRAYVKGFEAVNLTETKEEKTANSEQKTVVKEQVAPVKTEERPKVKEVEAALPVADTVKSRSEEITTYVPNDTAPVKKDDSLEKTEAKQSEQRTGPNPKTGLLTYHIQIGAGAQPPQKAADIQAKFGAIYTDSLSNNMVRYMVGNFINSTDAYSELIRVRKAGFPDAFVVRYQDGVRK